MSLAHTLIVEGGGKEITVTLQHPLTLAEIWRHFTNGRARRPEIVTLSKGTARVTFC